MFRFRMPGSRAPHTAELCYTVRLLDGRAIMCTLQRDVKGRVLIDHVCNHLNLLERDYFGIRFMDVDKQRHWLDPKKLIVKQMKSEPPYTLCFRVKFYPGDPSKLKEEISRYQLYLQIKRDLFHGRLLCPMAEAAWLGAYVVQAELGDYDPTKHWAGYVAAMHIFPHLSSKLEEPVTEIHQYQLRGQSSPVAESHFLARARELNTYGVDPHPCKDTSGATLFLGFTPAGCIVFKGNKRVLLLSWPQVGKLKFEGKTFYIHSIQSGKKSVLTFHTSTPAACKHLWKCAVENQAFYKYEKSCDIKTVSSSNLFFCRSRFRYSGKVAKEVLEASSLISRKCPTVQRHSFTRCQNPLSSSQQSLNISGNFLPVLEPLENSISQGLDSLKEDLTPVRSKGMSRSIGSKPGCSRPGIAVQALLRPTIQDEVWPGGCLGLVEDGEDMSINDQPLTISDLAYHPSTSVLPTPLEDALTIDSIFACDHNKFWEAESESTCDEVDFATPSLSLSSDEDGIDDEPTAMDSLLGLGLALVGQADPTAQLGPRLCWATRLLLLVLGLIGLLVALLEMGIDIASLRDFRQSPDFEQIHQDYLQPLACWLRGNNLA
uniref:FERM domain-containing protein 3-like n=1 Tax=Myxine glutinosa TaxID=7769 RepID=UPI00358DF34E